MTIKVKSDVGLFHDYVPLEDWYLKIGCWTLLTKMPITHLIRPFLVCPSPRLLAHLPWLFYSLIEYAPLFFWPRQSPSCIILLLLLEKQVGTFNLSLKKRSPHFCNIIIELYSNNKFEIDRYLLVEMSNILELVWKYF